MSELASLVNGLLRVNTPALADAIAIRKTASVAEGGFTFDRDLAETNWREKKKTRVYPGGRFNMSCCRGRITVMRLGGDPPVGITCSETVEPGLPRINGITSLKSFPWTSMKRPVPSPTAAICTRSLTARRDLPGRPE